MLLPLLAPCVCASEDSNDDPVVMVTAISSVFYDLNSRPRTLDTRLGTLRSA
jgi:hypothetical protein